MHPMKNLILLYYTLQKMRASNSWAGFKWYNIAPCQAVPSCTCLQVTVYPSIQGCMYPSIQATMILTAGLINQFWVGCNIH